MFDVGKFAAMTASLKLEHHGPFRGSEEDVRAFANTIEQPFPREVSGIHRRSVIHPRH